MTKPITRAHIVALAKSWTGTPYHHQQSVKHVGTDCLGLIRGIWRELYDGTEPQLTPPYTRDWAEILRDDPLYSAACRWFDEVDKKAARPGDILLFRYRRGYPSKHVGLVIAPRRMIHACEHLPVSEFPLTGWWTRRTSSAFSFPGVVD